MIAHITKLIRIYQYSVRQFIEDDCLYQASGLTFTALLSIVPLLFVCVTVLSALPLTQGFVEQAESLLVAPLTAHLPEESILPYIREFLHQVHRLSALGALGLLGSATWMLYIIEQTFNRIWRVHHQRRGASAFFLYWALLTLLPLSLGVSLAVRAYVLSHPWLSEIPTGSYGLWVWLGSWLPECLMMGIFMLLYMGIPHCTVRARHAALGAVTATVLSLTAKWAFYFYFRQFDAYQLVYGAFANIPVFLLWLYTIWLVVLFGAEVSQVVSRGCHFDKSGPELDGFTHTMLWLKYLNDAQLKGHLVTIECLVNQDDFRYQVVPYTLLNHLADAGLIRITLHEQVILLRSISTITLEDLYVRLPWKIPAIHAVGQVLDASHQRWLNHLQRLEQVGRPLLQTPLSRFYGEDTVNGLEEPYGHHTNTMAPRDGLEPPT